MNGIKRMSPQTKPFHHKPDFIKITNQLRDMCNRMSVCSHARGDMEGHFYQPKYQNSFLHTYCNYISLTFHITEEMAGKGSGSKVIWIKKPTHRGLYFYFYHLVLVHAIFDESLDSAVALHEDHVGGVGREQRHTFPHGDDVIQEEDDEHDQIQDVEGDVAEEWPPCQVEDFLGEDSAHPNHKEDVEDGRAHDGADAHVALCDEDADDGGEELRG